MKPQPNTEDGNEWLDEILSKILSDMSYEIDAYGYIDSKEYIAEHRKVITDYIQSNYILKSDVEKIIKQAKPNIASAKSKKDFGAIMVASGYNQAITNYEDNLIKKASQYGLTPK